MDATTTLLTYREAARGLWNSYLRVQVRGEVDFDAVDRFRGICDALFEDLVLRPLGMAEAALPVHGQPHPCLVIRLGSPDAPVRVRRPTTEGQYWDDPVTRLKQDGLSMNFIGFYDFDDFGFIDLQFFRVRISRCAEHPHLVGREALVEVRHGVVEFVRRAEP